MGVCWKKLGKAPLAGELGGKAKGPTSAFPWVGEMDGVFLRGDMPDCE